MKNKDNSKVEIHIFFIFIFDQVSSSQDFIFYFSEIIKRISINNATFFSEKAGNKTLLQTGEKINKNTMDN